MADYDAVAADYTDDDPEDAYDAADPVPDDLELVDRWLADIARELGMRTPGDHDRLAVRIASADETIHDLGRRRASPVVLDRLADWLAELDLQLQRQP